MAGQAKDFTALYGELNKFGQAEDFEKAIKSANRILHLAPDEEKAFHCKIVCLIQLGKLDEAFGFLNKNSSLAAKIPFEKAYCEYALNRPHDALKTLRELPSLNNREQELLGQVLYKLEEYDECLGVYRNLVRNTHDDFEMERETNLSAVIAAKQAASQETIDDEELHDDTYELCYNKTCLQIAQGLYKDALRSLEKAEELCRKTYEDDPEAFEDDIDAELSVIRVQKGYVLQKLGRIEEASKLYNMVLKQKPSDIALIAVAANNVITINKDQNVFDSKKKQKMVSGSGLQHKLMSHQKKSVAMNQALLYIYTNQKDLCLKTVDELERDYPDVDRPFLIRAALHCHEKQVGKAVDVLKDRISNSGCSVSLKLTLAQLYLSQGHVYQACDVLRDLEDLSYKPGVVSALVTMYLSQEDKDQASTVLNNAVDWYQKKQPNSPDLPVLIRSNADFQLRHGDPKVAAEMLEHLRKRDPKDLKSLAQLIFAYSKFDQKKAQAELPSPEEMAADIDVDALETAASTFGAKFIRKSNKAEASPKPKSPTSEVETELKKKKKKNKKGKLPKNMDNPPDPERWLPRRERSYYRGKRKDKRKEIGKGTQGAASAGADLDANKPASASGSEVGSPRPGATVGTPGGNAPQPTAAAAPPSGAGPRQQKPVGKQQQKKKKKGGKW